jgi:hypothetical protein
MSISLLNNSMSVTYDENGLSDEQIIELLDDLGYDSAVWEKNAAQEEKSKTFPEERTVQIRFEGIPSRFVGLFVIYLIFTHLMQRKLCSIE